MSLSIDFKCQLNRISPLVSHENDHKSGDEISAKIEALAVCEQAQRERQGLSRVDRDSPSK